MNKARSTRVWTAVHRCILLACGVLFLSSLAGCYSRARLIRDENEVVVEELASVWGSWIKDKDEKYDLLLNIENQASHGIVIPVRHLRCMRGRRFGELRVHGRHGHRRAIHLYPGEVETVVVTCQLANGDITGDFRILVGHIFQTPARGPKDLMATDIEWVIPEGRIH